MDTSSTTFNPVQVPFDESGYCESFLSSDSKLIDFFWKYGFVVVRDAITEEQIQDSVNHIWGLMEKAGASRNPQDWLKTNWVKVFQSNYNLRRGFLGFDRAVDAPGLHNIQSPPIYEAFSKIFNQKNLWAKLDRYGVMRPTKGIPDPPQIWDPFCGDKKVDKPDWKTESNWIHWDQNPWSEPLFCRVQALLTLTDHNQTSGGFHCIPGFSGHMETWAKQNSKLKHSSCLIDFPATDPIRQYIIRITMRPGSLLMWDSRTPHGNWPNDSDKWRMVQYTGMCPTPDDRRIQDHRKMECEKMIRLTNANLTQLGRKVLGTQFYDHDEVTNGGIAKGGIFDASQCGFG